MQDTATAPAQSTAYAPPDYFLLDELLSEEQRQIRASVRAWVNHNLMPIIEDYAQRSECPTHLIPAMGELGLFGPHIPEAYGGGGLDQVTYGLIMQEIERCDSGIRSMCSVQSSLVMYPVWRFGTEAQKQRFLPKLATGEWMGAFGLTEPDHGSNPGGMTTNYVDKGDHVLLNGSKMWISNSPFCQVAVVWAKNEQGRVKGLVVERGMEGFSAPEIHNKWSLRASATGELVFDNVKVPKENLLPEADGLKAPLTCLDSARYGIAWGAIGAAAACYDTALRYSLERQQFGKPIAGFQLTQQKLAAMVTEISKAQLMAHRLGELRNAGKSTPQMVSMAKRNNVAMALDIARESRQILGGMGIVGDYPIMRHMMNLESVITYEGTHEIHTLITGYDITGIAAFK